MIKAHLDHLLGVTGNVCCCDRIVPLSQAYQEPGTLCDLNLSQSELVFVQRTKPKVRTAPLEPSNGGETLVRDPKFGFSRQTFA